ncbi:putative rho-associated protein kinase [Plasmopara halstedii]
MPLCAACCITKGYNKFHGGQRHLLRPVCKECFRTGKRAVELGGDPEKLPIRAPGDKETASLNDFQLLKVLLVRHSAIKTVHAMKIISKQFIINMDSVHYMKTERDVMTRIRHPFVIGLHYAFQTDSKVYLVMEYQSGGELFSYLKEEGTFTEDAARFYLAEMILALEHLHGHGIIHRDLKPENVLISAEGHIKLTDFGLAKEFIEGQDLMTICGTKEYMAPEMLLGKGYDSAADWWSLGALAYEMLVGKPPFTSRRTTDLHKQILSAKIQLPPWLSGEAHSLLKSLLERNVSKRLGGGKSSMFVVKGVHALKRHPFFKSVNWKKMETLCVPPPMVPNISDEADTSYFDKKFTSMSASDLFCDAVIDEDNNLFRGFSFCRRESIKGFL